MNSAVTNPTIVYEVESESICGACHFESTVNLRACPHCGKPMQARQLIRRLGWVLLLIGSGLTLFMLWLSVFLGNVIWHSGQPQSSTHFTGGPVFVVFMYLLFLLVIAFGATSMAAGIFQIRQRRRSPQIIALMMTLAIAFLAVGCVLQWL